MWIAGAARADRVLLWCRIPGGVSVSRRITRQLAFQADGVGMVGGGPRVARLRVTVSGLLPVMALLAPLEIWRWGWSAGALHLAVQVAAGMLLIEILFTPSIRSHLPAPIIRRLNLIFLAVAYLYGFTTYSFQIADLEAGWKRGRGARRCAWPGRPRYGMALRRFRRRGTGSIRFEGGEPAIQTLELS